jgi:DNA topoisomerase-1
VESPSKCKKIEKFLGFQYKCIASNGHIRGLVSIRRKKTGILYEPIFEILPEKKTHVEHIRHIILQFAQENIFIATDDDREGEAIGWHICQTFGLDISVVKRIVFNEITETALKTAVQHPMKVRMSIVVAQQTRQILDQMVGYEISPILTRKMGSKEPLSAGRCQTPALRFIYDKCSGTKYALSTESLQMKYQVVGYFFSTFSSVSAITFPLPLEISLTSTEFSEIEIKSFLADSLDFGHCLKLGDPKEKRSSPPTPFHTSALLQTANSVLNLSPKKTMDYCQLLYQHGFITYMRTESTKYADIFLQQVEKFLQVEIKGKEDNKWIGDWTNIRNQAKNIHPHCKIFLWGLFYRQ